MQHLTAAKSNVTDSQCSFCWDDMIYIAAATPYILISLPFNGWILWQMVSSPLFWTDRMKVHEFHLVLAELLVGLLELVSNSMVLFRNFNISFHYSISQMIIVALAVSMFTSRSEFQSLICIDRYLAVVHPVLYLRFKATWYRMGFSCVVWIKNIGFTVIQMHLCEKHFVAITLHILSFGWHFIINSFCCLTVLRALKLSSPGEGEKVESNIIKKRAFNIVLLFQVTTFLSNLPMIFMLLLHSKMDDRLVCVWHPVAYCMMMWSGAIYSIVYLRKAREISRK